MRERVADDGVAQRPIQLAEDRGAGQKQLHVSRQETDHFGV